MIKHLLAASLIILGTPTLSQAETILVGFTSTGQKLYLNTDSVRFDRKEAAVTFQYFIGNTSRKSKRIAFTSYCQDKNLSSIFWVTKNAAGEWMKIWANSPGSARLLELVCEIEDYNHAAALEKAGM